MQVCTFTTQELITVYAVVFGVNEVPAIFANGADFVLGVLVCDGTDQSLGQKVVR